MLRPPKLDNRNQNDFYNQLIQLANVYCNTWTSLWESSSITGYSLDVGIALFKLFSIVVEYVANQVNKIPDQRFIAFLNFMGIQRRLPIPAQVPLVFSLKEQSHSILINAGTKVQQSINPKIIFQINCDLFAVPAKIVAGLFIQPDQDAFMDVSHNIINGEEGFYLFGNPNNTLPLNHLLLLGDSTLFSDKDAIQSLTITLTGNNLLPSYFAACFDGDGNPLKTEQTASHNNQQLIIQFDQLPVAKKLSATTALNNNLGIQTNTKKNSENNNSSSELYWIAVRPQQDMKILSSFVASLPVLSSITCSVQSFAVYPSATLSNGNPVNIKNGAYPFGETPQVNDAFYIGSDEIFNKKGANIQITFSIQQIMLSLNTSITATLVWEFWNGSQWQGFNDTAQHILEYDFKDTVGNFIQNDNSDNTYISFNCPEIKSVKVGNQTSLWIRVRINSGSYGNPTEIQTTSISSVVDQIPENLAPHKKLLITYFNTKAGINFGFNIKNQKYYPPFINALTISYTYTAFPQQVIINNNFLSENMAFTPYIPVPDYYPTFYLGFDQIGFKEHVVGNPLTLFFAISELPSSHLNIATAKNSLIQWEYYSTNGQWSKLPIEDTTEGLQTQGIVSFIVPKDINITLLFGQNLYWLRIVNMHDDPINSPWTMGIYPNVVAATNIVTINNEILGSGNGMPSQIYKFSHIPVLQKQIVEIIESSYSKELQIGKTQTNDSKTDNNAVENSAVEWREVDNFNFSTPASRHYVLNHLSGIIEFGDGVHGMVAPSGTNNIIAKQYTTCNGINGNVPANTITTLTKHYPNISKVSNPIASYGGTNADTINEVKIRGPQHIKNRGYAVTAEDLAWLAINSSPRVVKAIAQTGPNQNIYIYILTEAIGSMPMPNITIVREVTQFIQKRVLVLLRNKIYVQGPVYLIINITLDIIVSDLTQMHKIKTQVSNFCENYLNPLNGNTDKQGWNFGAYINASKMNKLIQKISGIEQVSLLTMNGIVGKGIQLAANALPCCGDVEVNISM